ncbi:ABC transporter permease [Leifsonia sp. YAF41]|uniref:ABC transporter permease n=1 Tax=Leifsonia sp. YAF41 TaxID=3233086 RepID=UPI003F9D5E9B
MNSMVLTRKVTPMRTAGGGRGMFTIAAGVLGAVLIAAIFAPLIAPHSPFAVNLGLTNAPPGTPDHILGTDGSGRDMLSRLIYGAQTSLIGPTLAIVVSVVLGVGMGAAAAWADGWVDTVLTRIIDFLLAFPGLLVAVFAVALFGPGLVAPAIGIAIAYAPVIARVTRSVVLTERGKLYVVADRVMGFSSWRTLTTTLLPNIAPLILSQCVVSFGYALVDLAALSFLGLGVQPPAADWGLMLNESLSSLLLGAWWVMAFPAGCLVIVIVSINAVGEGLLERLSRRSK